MDFKKAELAAASTAPQQDIHRAFAVDLFGVPYDQVTDEQRRVAKAYGWGRAYGLDFNTAGKGTGHGPR